MKYRVTIEIEKPRKEGSYDDWSDVYSQIVEDLKVSEVVSNILLCSKAQSHEG